MLTGVSRTVPTIVAESGQVEGIWEGDDPTSSEHFSSPEEQLYPYPCQLPGSGGYGLYDGSVCYDGDSGGFNLESPSHGFSSFDTNYVTEHPGPANIFDGSPVLSS